MRTYLVFIFLTFINPVWGNTKTPSPTPSKEIKQSTASKPIPAKKKSSKSKKEESKTLIVKTALKSFVLTYSKKRVAIKGYQMDLSLDRKKCNAHIIERFNKETTQLIKDALKSKEMKNTVKKKEINTVEIQMEGKSYFTQFSSKVAQTFLYYPKEVLRMKWEEKFNCEKKKKQSTKQKKNKKIIQ